MGNPLKRKKLRKLEAFRALQEKENIVELPKEEIKVPIKEEKKEEVPNALVFLEEKKEEIKQEEVKEELESSSTEEKENLKNSKKKKSLQGE